eukprot:g6408.t1
MTKKSNSTHIKSSKSFLEWKDMRWLFHILFCLYFVRVFVWHVSPESAMRPTRSLFGGYFRYFTICVFTFQILQLTAATLVDSTPYGTRLGLKRLADDMSCAVFVLANAVTVLFFAIETFVPGGVIMRSLGVPVTWVNFSVHLLNSVTAWTDIIISHPRRFSKRSFTMIACFSCGYLVWMWILKCKTGKYPYGFLNVLPDPFGLLFIVPVAGLVMIVFFVLGKKLSQMTKNVMTPEQLEDLDVVVPVKTKDNGQILSDAEEVNALKLD